MGGRSLAVEIELVLKLLHNVLHRIFSLPLGRRVGGSVGYRVGECAHCSSELGGIEGGGMLVELPGRIVKVRGGCKSGATGKTSCKCEGGKYVSMCIGVHRAVLRSSSSSSLSPTHSLRGTLPEQGQQKDCKAKRTVGRASTEAGQRGTKEGTPWEDNFHKYRRPARRSCGVLCRVQLMEGAWESHSEGRRRWVGDEKEGRRSR